MQAAHCRQQQRHPSRIRAMNRLYCSNSAIVSVHIQLQDGKKFDFENQVYVLTSRYSHTDACGTSTIRHHIDLHYRPARSVEAAAAAAASSSWLFSSQTERPVPQTFIVSARTSLTVHRITESTPTFNCSEGFIALQVATNSLQWWSATLTLISRSALNWAGWCQNYTGSVHSISSKIQPAAAVVFGKVCGLMFWHHFRNQKY